MKVSYNGLWKILIDKNMNKKELALTNRAKLNRITASRRVFVSSAFANKKVVKTETPGSIPTKV